MSDTQDDIARRVRALLAKTVENGCTEQEALATASCRDGSSTVRR